MMVRTHFKDIMEGSIYDWIDPNDCVPFTKTRPITESGIRRLMALFDASFEGSSISSGGITCGTDTPIVVKLTGTLLSCVYDYFEEQGYSDDELKQRVQSRDTWYGIVDGEHSFHAISRLIESSERWFGYKWFVTVIRSGSPVEKYRQLARMQNERHDNKYYIQYTFFDTISNLRTEYDRLCKSQKRVSATNVVAAYAGYEVLSKKVSTLVQTANTVMRLPPSVIKAIGDVSNGEHPDLVLNSPSLNKRKSLTVNEVMQKEDCRVFRNFLHITSLKSAKTFMNAKSRHGERAQINTIYRVQQLYRDRSFTKAIQPEELTDQYVLSLYSIEEEEKFLKYISPDSWPLEMETIRHNLLKNIQLSEEVRSNHGNVDILPSLKRAFKRHFPAKYIIKEQQFKELQNPMQTKDIDDKDNDEPPIPPGIEDSNEESKIPESLCKGSSTEKNDSNEHKPDPSPSKIEALEQKGIKCHNLRWEEYISEVWKSTDKPFDAVITNPPSSPSLSFIHKSNKKRTPTNGSDEELDAAGILEIAKVGKKLLKPGGYFIILIEFDLFQDWYLALKANGYIVMPRMYTFSYKLENINSRNLESKDFPSGLDETCILARLPGTHPDGFNPNFNSHFNLIECNWSRRYSIVTNVEVPKHRLCYPNSRKPCRMSEKPISLLAELIDLFVPPYGSCIDLFAGTLTLPIAALKTSRRCVAIEKDQACFDLAIDRLNTICDPVFKFVQNKDCSLKLNYEDGGEVDKSISDEKEARDSSTCCDTGQKSSNRMNKEVLQKYFIEDTSRDVDDVESAPRSTEKSQEIGRGETNRKVLGDQSEVEIGQTLLQLTRTPT